MSVFFGRNFLIWQGWPRAGAAVLSLWGLYGAYQAYRWVWPGPLAEDASFGASLEYYRAELERKRDHLRHVWSRGGLTYCFLGLALIVVPATIEALKTPEKLRLLAPFFLLLTLWAIAFAVQKRRNRMRIQRELDELRDLDG